MKFVVLFLATHKIQWRLNNERVEQHLPTTRDTAGIVSGAPVWNCFMCPAGVYECDSASQQHKLSPHTDLSWKPDGKVVAIGNEDG